jgi:hypothetical protein
MDHKKVIWIFGDSAAGKETFIRAATSSVSSEVVSVLGWSTKAIAACEASIRWIGQFDAIQLHKNEIQFSTKPRVCYRKIK